MSIQVYIYIYIYIYTLVLTSMQDHTRGPASAAS